MSFHGGRLRISCGRVLPFCPGAALRRGGPGGNHSETIRDVDASTGPECTERRHGTAFMIRLAVVGLGKMGLSHLSMIRVHPEVDLIGICDATGYVLDV